jgi:hypothetical protein
MTVFRDTDAAAAFVASAVISARLLNAVDIALFRQRCAISEAIDALNSALDEIPAPGTGASWADVGRTAMAADAARRLLATLRGEG